jgi:tetratricopeptide (TPR) repeat protein
MYIAKKSASTFLNEMIFGNSRFVRALRLAFYPALEPASAKHFEALTREARNARNDGDFAGAEQIYLRAMAEARASSDPSYLNYIRHGLAQVYQEQQRYQEAERLFREQLDEALESSQPNTQVHSAHMGLARLYKDQGKLAEAEEHYKAALAETEKPKLWTDREHCSSTALWLARFYVEQHRYSDAEPLFRRVVEIREADRPSDASLPHYLQELAKIYEGQEKYEPAENLYRRALKISEEQDQPKEFLIVRALNDLAQFYKARERYVEAEEFSRRSLAIVEEKIRRHSAADTKRLLRRPDDKDLEARVKRARIPISEALDRLAEVYESQDKYAESEPLRRRSIEIKQQAWGEENAWIWVDELVAHANALHKIGREDEATQLDERVEAIRTKYPHRSTRVTLTSRPLKRTLRGRFNVFVHALLHSSPR